MKRFSLTLIVGLCALALAAPASALSNHWNLTTDFYSAADQPTAVYPDLQGDAVWSFMLTPSLSRATIKPATYVVLDTLNPASHGATGAKAWQISSATGVDCNGIYPDSCAPMVGINTTGTLPFGTDWPVGTVMLHPASAQMVVVRWKNPYPTSVSVDVSASLGLIPGSYDGATYYIDYEAKNLRSGTLAPGAAKMQNFSQTVSAGKSLYFLVHPYGSHYADWVRFDLTIVKR